MAEVLDVVTKLSFESDNSDLVQASNLVKSNINNINLLTQALAKQQQQLSNTSRTDIQGRRNIQAAINATKAAIDKETKALEKNILANKDLQKTIAQEVGLLGKLANQMDVLKQKRDIATDPKKIQAYTKEIAALQNQVNNLTNGKTGTGLGGSILQGLGLAGGFGIAGAIAGGANLIGEFIFDSARLAGELEGVQRAFNRINSPGLLDNLREATKGTVSDLELMKKAVAFQNFGLPIEKLATALDFARRRARDTGQSVEYLVDSIVTGIGRQSPLILDNLGINAKRVSTEFQRTGDFAQAAFKIIQEESQKAGADIETFAEKQARLNAQIENSQAKFGQYLNEFKGFLFTIGEDLFNELGGVQTNLTGQYLTQIRNLRNAQENAAQEQENANALFLQNFQQFQVIW